MADPLPAEHDIAAAELALGVLDGEARSDALRRSLADPAFAAAVDDWRLRLAPLCDEYGSSEAPDVWDAIEARLSSNVHPAMGKLRFWRFATAGSAAIAASLAAILVFTVTERSVPERTKVQAPIAVAQLGSEGGALLAANFDVAQSELRIRAIALPASDLAPELWVIPADGVPRSLGLIGARGSTSVTIPAALRATMKDGVTLAVTMEPRTGAPHRAPSSVAIAAGKITRI